MSNRITLLFSFFILFSALFIAETLNAQISYSGKRYNNWYFGFQAGISFNTGSPTYINNSAMTAKEGCASMSEYNTGNLLFYTNGQYIWNSNNQIINPITPLFGGQRSSKQAVLIIPKPNSETNYYVFYTPEPYAPINMYTYYTEVSTSGGTVSLVPGTVNTLLYGDCRGSEKITATCGNSCENIWVISHTCFRDTFFFGKINLQTGAVSYSHKQRIGRVCANSQWGGVGEMKVSPNGKLLAVTTPWDGDLVELYDFDGSTGTLSNYRSYHAARPITVEFSPDSKFLYAGNIRDYPSDPGPADVLQFEVSTFGTPVGTPVIVYPESSLGWFDGIFSLQLAPDGKIYCCGRNKSKIYVINSPNTAGTNCNFSFCMDLPTGHNSTHSLPNIAWIGCTIDLPPEITDCPTDITVYTGTDVTLCGTNVSWTVPTAKDNCGDPVLTSNYSPGDFFPVGTTTVTYTATDAIGNQVSSSFNIEVIDNTVPVINNCPADFTVYTGNGETQNGTNVTWVSPTAIDNCGITSFTSNHATGGLLPIGQTNVTYTATDYAGNTATCSFVVNVIDNTAPTISISPIDCLWPPDHKMETINATITANDNCGSYYIVLESITSNEPDNGLGDGDKPIDIQGAGYGTTDYVFSLRRERSGTLIGRIYTITYKVTDAAGNVSYASTTVCVPHDQSGKNFGDNITMDENQDFNFINIYPNPSDNIVNINCNVTEKCLTTINIYNTLGNKVTNIVNQNLDIGYHSLKWNGKDDSGFIVPNGFYVIEFTNGNNREVKQIQIIK